MENLLLRFEFSSIHNTNPNVNYHVFAENMDILNIFLKQHNFTDVNKCSITVVENTLDPCDEGFILRPFTFKSNSNNTTYTIITCDHFVTQAIELLADDLNKSMIFGEAIFRQDIEIFKLISDCLKGLSHVHIIDFSLCDVDETELGDTTIKDLMDLNQKYMNAICSPAEDPDYYLTLQSITNDLDSNVMPITIECYVEHFASMMVDTFGN